MLDTLTETRSRRKIYFFLSRPEIWNETENLETKMFRNNYNIENDGVAGEWSQKCKNLNC